MKNKIKNLVLGIAVSVVLITLFIVNTFTTQAAVTNTAIASLATSTTSIVGPQVSTRLFNIRFNCASRVISTKGQAIMLGFNASTTVMGGFYQAASTTVAYPSNIYGCGVVNVLGISASTTIDIAEFLY